MCGLVAATLAAEALAAPLPPRRPTPPPQRRAPSPQVNGGYVTTIVQADGVLKVFSTSGGVTAGSTAPRRVMNRAGGFDDKRQDRRRQGA
jgi:hypothetical protein